MPTRPKLHGTHKGEDQAEEQIGDGHYGKGAHAALVHGGKKILAAHGAFAAKKTSQGECYIAHKFQNIGKPGREFKGLCAKALQKAKLPLFLLGPFPALDCERKAQKVLHGLRQKKLAGQAMCACRPSHVYHKGQKGTVPLSKVLRTNLDAG